MHRRGSAFLFRTSVAKSDRATTPSCPEQGRADVQTKARVGFDRILGDDASSDPGDRRTPISSATIGSAELRPASALDWCEEEHRSLPAIDQNEGDKGGRWPVEPTYSADIDCAGGA